MAKTTVRTSIDIDKEIMKEVKYKCVLRDISIKTFVIEAIKEKLGK